MTRPRSSDPSRARVPRLALAVLAAAAASCAAPLAVPPAAVVEQARVVPSYSASLGVSLRGPELRARTRVLLAFRRPDELRIEIPGPTGARLVAVARGDRLWAVFPGERAIYAGAARAEDLESLLGVALAPPEVMDLLTGVRSPRVREYRVRWGASLPRQIDATLPDGARLKATVEDAQAPATSLGESAFQEPPHAGYRAVDADQARALWSAR
jgi:hypothetical protein